jgi:hypothetical protein
VCWLKGFLLLLGLFGLASGALGLALRDLQATGIQKERGGALSMANTDELKTRFRALLLAGRGFEAETLAQELGKEAAPVLLTLSQSDSAAVRKAVLEVAGQVRDAGSCRVIVQSLDDRDAEIQELAGFLLRVCAHRELLPELLEAIKKHATPRLRGALALQIGMVGGATEIPRLRAYKGRTTDPQLVSELNLALARLGDAEARSALIARLQSLDVMVRYHALQDCLYVQDRTLAAHFGPALNDFRDVVQLTIPEESPTVYARVCDVAVMVLANLGFTLTYPAEDLVRHSNAELDEARRIVMALPGR